MVRIKVIKGRNPGTIYELGDEFFIGRAEYNDIQIFDETCSRHHARLKHINEQFIISDLGSNNGTFVNGKRTQSQVLKSGDNILIGETLLVFEDDTPVAGGVLAIDKGKAVTVVKGRPLENLKVETALTSTEVFLSQESFSSVDPASLYQRLNKLYQVTESLATKLTPTEVFETVLKVISDTIKIAKGYLILRDEMTSAFTSLITHEFKSIAPEEPELPISHTIVDQAIAEKKSLLVSDARLDATLRKRASVVRYKIGSVICVPLLVQNRCLGAVYLEDLPDEYVFTEEDLRFITILGRQAASALQHTQYYTSFESQVKELKETIASRFKLIGKSKIFNETVQLATKIAPTNTTVLILGATGTGKELIARLIHERSPRVNKPFIVINCAALVETLLESELFGHEKGSFTGASEKRKGKFELAHQGTVFLDEIGELSSSLQAKLLRVLEEKQFYSVGGTKPITVDVRVIAATNRPIEEAVRERTFRDDLYYRLATVTIKMPVLKERKEDIPQLAYYFLEKSNIETKKNIQGISNEAMERLIKYHWPGNIRELQNVIEHAVVLCETQRLESKDIPVAVKDSSSTGPDISETTSLSLKDAEKVCIIKALEETNWKKGEAAKILGISWPTLNKKMEEYRIKETEE